MGDIILELSFIIVIAAVLAFFARLIKQPTIIAYLLAGVILGPVFLNVIHATELIEIFAHLGVAFLLFIVGLSLDFRVLKDVGGVSFLVGIGQIIVTAVIGLLIVLGLGYDFVPALYIAAALAFSSTVVVVKLLSDKREIDTLHGKVAIGVLIVQDFVAALTLMTVPLIGGGDWTFVIIQLAKGLLLVVFLFLFSKIVLPSMFSLAANNQEILLLFSIGWALIISSLFSMIGFSIEIGALFAGMSLASSAYSLQIGSKIKGLRDFFVVIFFVYFGSKLISPFSSELIVHALILSALVLIGNPLIVMFLMKPFGYKKRTNFLTGITIAQISEFSLILVLLGFNLGAVSQSILSLTILVALITIALSSYTIYYSHKIFSLLSPFLWLFDGKGHKIDSGSDKKDYDIVLMGYNRIGFNLLRAFEKSKKKYLVVDFNPKTIEYLMKKKISCVYGDANDLDLLRELELSKKSLVISTIPDVDVNIKILKSIRNPDKTTFIATSHHIPDTKKLYTLGADYVIMPHFLGGEHVAHLLVRDHFKKSDIKKEGKRQMKDLDDRICEGHSHPSRDYHGE